MPVVVSLLRGVNVGGHHIIAMEKLCRLYESCGMRDPRSYVQSGNVVFKTDERDLVRLAARLEDVIERTFGFRPDVIVRTSAELSDVIAANPLSARSGIDPRKLLTVFLAGDPGADARKKVRGLRPDPEELRMGRREFYIYYPNGMGRSKLPWMAIEKLLQTPGTGRNWNTVLKLREMAEKLEAAS